MTAFNAAENTSLREVHPEWLPLNGQVTTLVQEWASRRDLQAYLGPDAGAGAPARFIFRTGEIDVNTVEAFGEFVRPEDIGDLTVRDTQYEWPKAMGLIFHESLHAAHSPEEMITEGHLHLTKREVKWMILLEEIRIESRGVRKYPQNRAFLRSCTLEIVLKSTDSEINTSSTEVLVGTDILARGRVEGGVLRPRDIPHITPHIDTLPEPMRHALEALRREFFALTGRDSTGREKMYQVAREVEKLVVANEKANGEESAKGLEDLIAKLLAALDVDRMSTEIDAAGEAYDQQQAERASEKAEERQSDVADEWRDRRESEAVFGHRSGPKGTNSNSTVVGTRPPTTEEMQTAGRIAHALNLAKYRDRLVVETVRSDPPGRLRPRIAMQASAAKSRTGRGERERYAPWRKTARKHVEDPNITVGIMCDISGSMGGAMHPIAVAAWVISNAVARVRGRAAAVYYGNSAFSVMKPGETLKEVTVYSARDGSEDFDSAFRALNGGLKLLTGSGARLLFICSDGHYYGEGQIEACDKHLTACRKSGVAVVWLDFGNSTAARGFCERNGAVHIPLGGGKVTDAAHAIGTACVKALASASQ